MRAYISNNFADIFWEHHSGLEEDLLVKLHRLIVSFLILSWRCIVKMRCEEEEERVDRRYGTIMRQRVASTSSTIIFWNDWKNQDDTPPQTFKESLLPKSLSSAMNNNYQRLTCVNISIWKLLCDQVRTHSINSKNKMDVEYHQGLTVWFFLYLKIGVEHLKPVSLSGISSNENVK